MSNKYPRLHHSEGRPEYPSPDDDEENCPECGLFGGHTARCSRLIVLDSATSPAFVHKRKTDLDHTFHRRSTDQTPEQEKQRENDYRRDDLLRAQDLQGDR